MKKTQKTSQIRAFHASKNGFGIVLVNGTTVPISELLLGILAKSNGFSSINGLLRNGVGATITYDEVDIKAGDSMGTDFRGNPRINMRERNADGTPNQFYNTNQYSTDHTRYDNIGIELSQKALNGLNYADAMIAAEGIVGKALQLPVTNNFDGTSPHAPLNTPAPTVKTAAELALETIDANATGVLDENTAG